MDMIHALRKIRNNRRGDHEETEPVVALMYDFDKTLCTKDMQEYTFIPNVGMTPGEFWTESNTLAKERKMDGILAYMYVMLQRHMLRDKVYGAKSS